MHIAITHIRVPKSLYSNNMSAAVLTVTAFAVAFADSVSFAAAARAVVSTNAPRTDRRSKELQEKLSTSVQIQYPDRRTMHRKSNPDDYNAYPSSAPGVDAGTASSSSSSSAVNYKVNYPSLTTGSPNFVNRGRFIKNPFYFSNSDQDMEFEDEPHHPNSHSTGAFPKWNRFNTNHRQLNKYGPTPIEADIMVDEDGSAGYGSTFDFGGGVGSGYDSAGSYRSPGNGLSGGDGGMMGWFSEPIAQSSRPVPIIAEIRQPSNHKMSVDLNKLGMLALIKIAVGKLKALGFIKAMLLVLFKLKLLVLLFKLKLLMVLKLLKVTVLTPMLLSVLMLPMLLSRLSRLNMLLNQPVLVPNNFSGTTDSTDTTDTTDDT